MIEQEKRALERATETAERLLPDWTRFRGEPLVRHDTGLWVVKARWPEAGPDHEHATAAATTIELACQRLLDWRRNTIFLKQKEPPHEDLEQSVVDDGRGGDSGAGSPGPAVELGAPAGVSDLGGDHGLAPARLDDDPLETAPQRLEEVEPDIMPSPAPLDADASEVSEPVEDKGEESVSRETIIEGHKPEAPPAYGGTLIERDEIARRVKELSVAISYAKSDRLEAMKETEARLNETYQRLYSEGTIANDFDTIAMNGVQADLAALIQRRAAIERFATSMVDALPGKTLEDLRRFDVASAPWPT